MIPFQPCLNRQLLRLPDYPHYDSLDLFLVQNHPPDGEGPE